ncbi:4a-hydroxytetrahydrobiopterin dehydratase [Frankia sp. B2]|uniref:4a-hydroxytetrahydrobiopterin dehydratase n=1 Tax=unclassified Frankia TaxID=2632575 RepID=UPI0006CA5D78|nr:MULTISPECIES: 4a-hydroxytetrahydrobiopterin dehydratase [unclassified Frankia]KPM56939.1 pterin-4-alpha-carbinolamine dehydratase [Frankia sp. R43]TFE26209.1 4a-hydroxytetrahydrobiopterin dehydratase [Frankia sp. B2]
MPDVPATLADDEIEARLREHPAGPASARRSPKIFRVRYHRRVALIVHVADIERLISRHADIDLRWDSIRFGITTHDAGLRLTAADFDLARRINAIAQAHSTEPL